MHTFSGIIVLLLPCQLQRLKSRKRVPIHLAYFDLEIEEHAPFEVIQARACLEILRARATHPRSAANADTL